MDIEEYFLPGKLYVFGGFDERPVFNGITPRKILWTFDFAESYQPKRGEVFMCVGIEKKTAGNSNNQTFNAVFFLCPEQKVVFDIVHRFSKRLIERWPLHSEYFEE